MALALLRLPAGVLLALLATTLPGRLAAQTVAENIYFLKPDGRSYLNYRTTRSPHKAYSLFLEKSETDAEFDYIYPNDFTFDDSSDPERNVILFNQGSYATIKPGRFETEVSRTNDGTYTFINWDEAKDPKVQDEFFGEWTSPDNFAQYVYTWVLPENFEFVDFDCNRQDHGVWRIRRNTLAWYGRNVNNIVFRIQYRARSTQAAQELRSSLAAASDPPDVAVSPQQRGVRVVLENEVLFPSGSATLSDEGRKVLQQLAGSLQESASGNRFVVEGHTDNIAISPDLKSQFDSNWELSAARAIAVVRFLQSTGIDGSRLEGRALGPHRPAVSNDTPEGRARNRRIEIHIVAEK